MQTAAARTIESSAKLSDTPLVLFVDDEEHIGNRVRSCFKTFPVPYEVQFCSSGKRALELISARRYHIVVSDQKMPEMTGVELLTQVRERSPNTVRILLTGHSDADAMVDGINDADIYRYVRKPWNNEELRTLISEGVRIATALFEAEKRSPIIRLADPVVSQKAGRGSNNDLMTKQVPPERRNVVVVDAEGGVFRDLKSKSDKSINLSHAGTVLDAVEHLKARRASVIVACVEHSDESAQVFLAMLKDKYPEIMTIVISAHTDPSTLVKNINNMKVRNFMKRPVNVALLLHYISSALVLSERHRQESATLLLQKSIPLAVPQGDTGVEELTLELFEAVGGLIRSLGAFFGIKSIRRAEK